MKIGYYSFDNVELISRSDNHLGVALKHFQLVALHKSKHVVESLSCVNCVAFKAVRLPLCKVHGILVGVQLQLYSKPIHRFQSPYGGGAYGDNEFVAVVADVFEVLARDGYFFHMHNVFANGVGAYGLESSRANVQGYELGGYAFGVQLFENVFGEMQSGGGGGHGALEMSVDGLVTLFVAVLRVAVQVGRERYNARMFDDFRKGDAAGPIEIHHPCVGVSLAASGGEGNLLVING